MTTVGQLRRAGTAVIPWAHDSEPAYRLLHPDEHPEGTDQLALRSMLRAGQNALDLDDFHWVTFADYAGHIPWSHRVDQYPKFVFRRRIV